MQMFNVSLGVDYEHTIYFFASTVLTRFAELPIFQEDHGNESEMGDRRSHISALE